MKKNIPTYPIWICHPCGVKHGNKKCGVATWHENTCDVCGKIAIVTEPRDFGHLKDTWIKAAESRSGGQQNCKHCGSTEDFWWSRTEPMGYYCSDCGKEYEPERTMNTDTPETDSAYIQRPNEGAWDFRVRQEKTMEKLERERDEAREELTAVTEQRDRLAEALKIDPYPDEPISDDLHGGNVYCEISVGEMRKIREALQSLTTNKL